METKEEITHKAFYLLEIGVNAMKDEIIENHLKILTQQPFTSSVEYFVQSGKVSGEFLLSLRRMLGEYGEICDKSLKQ